jgi:hypothetical protein
VVLGNIWVIDPSIFDLNLGGFNPTLSITLVTLARFMLLSKVAKFKSSGDIPNVL